MYSRSFLVYLYGFAPACPGPEGPYKKSHDARSQCEQARSLLYDTQKAARKIVDKFIARRPGQNVN